MDASEKMLRTLEMIRAIDDGRRLLFGEDGDHPRPFDNETRDVIDAAVRSGRDALAATDVMLDALRGMVSAFDTLLTRLNIRAGSFEAEAIVSAHAAIAAGEAASAQARDLRAEPSCPRCGVTASEITARNPCVCDCVCESAPALNALRAALNTGEREAGALVRVADEANRAAEARYRKQRHQDHPQGDRASQEDAGRALRGRGDAGPVSERAGNA